MKIVYGLSIFASVIAATCPDVKKDSCLRGGVPKNSCKGAECPPCWVKQTSGDWGCYEMLMKPDGTSSCPPWEGMMDIHHLPSSCLPPPPPKNNTSGAVICPGVPDDSCFRGGQTNYPCEGMKCPRCWLWEKTRWSCFEQVKGRCEWDNMVDILNLPENCELPECDS